MKKYILISLALLCGALALPAQIVTPPAPAIVATGTKVVMTVTCNGTAPLNYVWSKQAVGATGFTVIAGQTSAAFTIPAATVADAGQYKVDVSNNYGKSTTPSATLDAGMPPTVLSFGVVVTPPAAP